MAPEKTSKKQNAAPETAQSGKFEFKERFAKQLAEWHKKYKDSSDQGDSGREKDRVETNSTAPDHEIFGFQNEIKSMENFLLDQKVYKEFKSLVIVGEYGVGKTTLCKMIFNKEEVKSVYAPRIWVSMHIVESEQGIYRKICVLKKILKGLGVEDSMLEFIKEEAKQEYKDKCEQRKLDRASVEEEELAALLYALHLNLRWKKYLIVFDDMREKDSWEDKLDQKLKEDEIWGKHLSDGFPRGSGGRVIYTTRDNDLAKKLVTEEHQIHRLWPLTDSLSVWKIYEASYKEGNASRDLPRNDKKCIDELMNKSRGLPLATRLLAKLDPVFLDDEKPEEGSAHGTADPGNPANPADQTST